MNVPEYLHRCSTIQRGWVGKPSISFSTRFGPGVRLLDALRGNLEGVDDKDELPFDARCGAITIRIRVCPRCPCSDNNLSLKFAVPSSRGTLPALLLGRCWMNRGREMESRWQGQCRSVEEV